MALLALAIRPVATSETRRWCWTWSRSTASFSSEEITTTLVDGDGEHYRVVPEDPFDAGAVVHVEID